MESVYNEIAYWIEFFQRLIFAKQFFVCCVLIWLYLKKTEKKNIIYMICRTLYQHQDFRPESKLINNCYSEITCISGPGTWDTLHCICSILYVAF